MEFSKRLEELAGGLARIADELRGLAGTGGRAGSPAIEMEPTYTGPEADPDFAALKELLDSPLWPVAVPPELICDENSEEDKQSRAEAVLDQSLPLPLAGKKFLDFGCGEGHAAAKAATSGVSLAYGYDIDDKGWEKHAAVGGLVLTKDFEKVRAAGPYDLVLAYDVLDHAVGESPAELLKKIKSVLAPGGHAVLRMHPFCSSHATHLYRRLNKSHLHLVFSQAELEQMGLRGLPSVPVIHPLITYRGWLKEAGLRVVQEAPVVETVGKFFESSPKVARRIKSHWKDSPEPELASGSQMPGYQMSTQFVDYLASL